MREVKIQRNGIFDERIFIETEKYFIDIYRTFPTVRVTKKGDWKISTRLWKKTSFNYEKGIPRTIPMYIKEFIIGQVEDAKVKKIIKW